MKNTKTFKRLVAGVLCSVAALGLVACGGSAEEIVIPEGMTYGQYLVEYEANYYNDGLAIIEELEAEIEAQEEALIEMDIFDMDLSIMTDMFNAAADTLDEVTALKPSTDLWGDVHEESVKSWSEPGSAVLTAMGEFYANFDIEEYFAAILTGEDLEIEDMMDGGEQVAIDMLTAEVEYEKFIELLDTEIEQ